MARAGYSSINEWLEGALNPDLFVSPAESLTNRSFRFPPAVGEELRNIPGIRKVQAVRSGRYPLRGQPVLFVAIDVASLEQSALLRPTSGDQSSMYRETAAGRGVIISDNLANIKKLRLGEILEIQAPKGPLRLPVAGIVVDFSDQKGSVLLDRAVFNEMWGDDSVNIFRIYVSPGADPGVVRARILERFGNMHKLFVLTNQDVRDYILKLTGQWFGLSYVQLAVAVLVAVLGIVNTLIVSIADRRRELGVLQAVGGLRNQVRRTVWMEALAIGVVGLILGLALGAVSLYYSLDLSKNDLGGVALEYQYPSGIALLLLPVILSAAFIAALGPGEQAVRGSLVEALEYE
jgi:putative ABC transport system permease protein